MAFRWASQMLFDDYPQLEPDDFLAVYAYAAELARSAKPPEDEAPLRRKPVAAVGSVIARRVPEIGKCAPKWACPSRRPKDSRLAVLQDHPEGHMAQL